jgi:hypothetical protein
MEKTQTLTRLLILTCRHRGAFSLLLLIALAMAAAAVPGGQADHPTDRRIDAAIAAAFDWIESHRATLEDGGLTDMIDEGVAFRFFRGHAPTASQREHFSQLFAEQMASLNELTEFEAWARRPNKPLIEHYHLVLAAHLSKTAGVSSPLSAVIAERAQRALATLIFDSPTVRLTTALFLSRLDSEGVADLAALLSRSMIEQLNRQPMVLPGPGAPERLVNTAGWWLYALVHELVALTDFGRLPASPWLTDRRDAVVDVLLEAVTWASAQRNHDLLAEVTVTLYFLGEPLRPPLQAALDKLLADQRPDGSWGASTVSTRRNKVRHTVLTASAALLAYRAWRQLGE